MPGPWSWTVTEPAETLTSTGDGSGLNFTALSRTLTSARNSAPGRATTFVGVASTVTVRPVRRAVRSAARCARASRAMGSSCSVCRASPVSSTSSVAKVPSSLSSLSRDASTRSRISGSRSTCRRSVSRFVRRLVSGVRSSWLASCTRRCCCARDSSSAASIALNDRAKRPTSSRRCTAIGCSSRPLTATSSAAFVSRTSGRAVRLAISQPAITASPIKHTPMISERSLRELKTVSVFARLREMRMVPH